jgi:peptidoglycan hydrolase-like protein with peptidoglycan-binding domain
MNRGAVVSVVALAAVAATFGVQSQLREPDETSAAADRARRLAPSRKALKAERPRAATATTKDATAKAPSQKKQQNDKPRKPRELSLGMKGPDVRSLQIALADSTYDPGPTDGSFGYMTQHAVLAFEKVHEMERNGVVSIKEAQMIDASGAPKAPDHASSTYVDVDITRQVLFEVRDGKVIHTLPISTANGATYQSRSGLATATTPRGEFSIYSQTSGWRESYLGSLYSPSYFYGGYAIHGSTSVPAYPASHGCVRIPMHSTPGFFERNGVGTPVYVHD